MPVGKHRVRLREVFVDKADNASRAVKSQLGISWNINRFNSSLVDSEPWLVD